MKQTKEKNNGLPASYQKKHTKKLILSSLFSVLNKVFDLAPPFLISASVDVAVRKGDSFVASIGITNVTDQFIVLGCVTFFIWIMESLFEYLYKIYWQNLAQTVQHDLRIKTYEHIRTLELAFFEDSQTGGIMSVLNNDINQLERFLNDGISEIIKISVTVIVISASFFLFSPQLAWMAMVSIAPLILFSIRCQNFLKPKYLAVREKVGILNGILSNNLTGITTIKSYVTEKYESGRVEKVSGDYRKANRKAIACSAGFVPLIRMIIVVGLAPMLKAKSGLTMFIFPTKTAGIHDFISGLPDGYDTLVGERGQKLSGGQRQRISIVRAVLKDPPILVLDEATSSVDSETEAAIQRSLEKLIKGRTTIIIAHHLSTVRNADHIYVIGNRGIIEEGSHDKLIRHKGLYASLWNVQTGMKNK